MIKTLDELERRTNMVDFELSQCEETQKLLIRYTPKTNRLGYGISDLDGRVISRGDLNGDTHEIGISHLKSGRYVIWLMDGEDMIRTNFKVV